MTAGTSGGETMVWPVSKGACVFRGRAHGRETERGHKTVPAVCGKWEAPTETLNTTADACAAYLP